MRLNYEELGIIFIIECFKLYFSNNYAKIIGVIYLISLIYFLFIWKKEGKFLFFVNLIWAIMILNPITIRVLCNLGFDSRYYRMLWIFPLMLNSGIFIVCILKYKIINIIVITILTGICICLTSGKTLKPIENVQKWENLYKVPNDIIDISEILADNNIGEKVVLYHYIFDYLGMREYDATIVPFTTVYVQEGWLEAKQITDGLLNDHIQHERWERVLVLAAFTELKIEKKDLFTALHECVVDYYVLDKESKHYYLFIEAGCKVIGENESYGIMVFEKDKNNKY